MSDVISLHGDKVDPQPGTPNELAIENARDLLNKCETGDIVGFVAATVGGDGLCSYQGGGQIVGYSMIGALEASKIELMSEMLGED